MNSRYLLCAGLAVLTLVTICVTFLPDSSPVEWEAGVTGKGAIENRGQESTSRGVEGDASQPDQRRLDLQRPGRRRRADLNLEVAITGCLKFWNGDPAPVSSLVFREDKRAPESPIAAVNSSESGQFRIIIRKGRQGSLSLAGDELLIFASSKRRSLHLANCDQQPEASLALPRGNARR